MSLLAQIVIAIAIFVAGGAAGIKYHAGQDAIAARQADEARQTDARQQRQFGDLQAGQHAAALAKISNQLGNARETIARLSGRDCLDPATVGVLNAIGGEPVRAAAGEPAGEGGAASSGTGLRFSTDRDLAGAIAICRARYAEVSTRLNSILDIEDRRHPSR